MLSYFCGDDTLSIFEPPQRNTGMTGGRYLDRARVSESYPPTPLQVVLLHINFNMHSV